MNAPRRSRTDPIVVLEAALVVLLLAVFILLYVVPTETRLEGVPWWSPVVLVGLFLTVIGVDAVRRKRRGRRMLDEMFEDHGRTP